MLERFDLEKTYQYLLVVLAFLMPLTVSGANTIIVIIVCLWLFSGDYKSKYNHIMSSKLMIASIVFYCLHVIGMLWTEDLKWGFHILHKMWYFLLLFPILFNIVQKIYIKYYISAFLIAIAVTEIASYLVWFEIIAPFRGASVRNPTPFMSHISYNPILTLAIYIVYHEIFFKTNLSGLKFFFYSFFAITMTINMFITGGRAGQVAYFAMLAIILFQFFNKAKIKALIGIMILIPIIFYIAYQTSNMFHVRVDQAINEVLNYNCIIYGIQESGNLECRNTSIGQRLTFTINSWEVIKQNPIIGIGTGDFPTEYNKINQINSPEVRSTTNPHNMYILVLMQLGLVGLISMLTIFYYQIKLSFCSSNRFFRDVGITLPILFLIMMLSDSYILGHFTTLVFVFFSSFLYRNFEKS